MSSAAVSLPAPPTDLNTPFVTLGGYVMKLYKEHMMSFDEIEMFLRKQNSFIYLFGEDPKKSRYFLPGYEIRDRNNTIQPYSLKISARETRDAALLDTDPGCYHALTNLERLKKTGVLTAMEQDDEKFVECEVDRLCACEVIGNESEYIEPY